jgi:hypothetical protein
MSPATALTQHPAEISRIAKPVRPTKATASSPHRRDDLFRRDGRSQAPSALRSSALENLAPRFRPGALPETVLSESLDPTRLIRPLHDCGSPAFSRQPDRSDRSRNDVNGRPDWSRTRRKSLGLDLQAPPAGYAPA